MSETEPERVARMIREGREEQARLKALRESCAEGPALYSDRPRVWLHRRPAPKHSGPAWLRQVKIDSINRALAGDLSEGDRRKLELLLREVQSFRDLVSDSAISVPDTEEN